MERLDDAAISAALASLPEWSRDGDILVRSVRRKGFRDAVAFINAIAEEAEARNHHPDLHLTDYRNVTVRLTTHSARGITTNDTELAAAIEALVEAAPG
jgi:4a-hydroxytetrahydrobiopterin dehydratase